MIFKKSREHLKIVGEGYFKHGIPLIGVGFHIFGLGFIFIIHAIVPGFFPFYASKKILALGERIRERNIPEEQA